MDYIIRERKDLRGSELLCAIIIANYASVDDKCYPGLQRIAEDLRSSVRQTQAIIRRLEQKKVFQIVQGKGRGHKTSFLFQKDDENNIFSETQKDVESNILSEQEKMQDPTPFPEEKRRSFAQRKGEVLRKEKVKFCALPLYKDEPFKEPLEEPIRAADAAERVFENWRATLKHPKAVLDTKRRKRIEARLIDGFSIDDLLLVPQGVLRSPYHLGFNDTKTVYDGIDTIYRDRAQVEKFIELAAMPLNGNGFHAPPLDPNADCELCGNERTVVSNDWRTPCPKCRPVEEKQFWKARGR